MKMKSLNDGPNAVTVVCGQGGFAVDAPIRPKLAFLAEVTMEENIEREAAEAERALAAQQQRTEAPRSDDVIVIDDAPPPPTNVASDAEEQPSDEEEEEEEEGYDSDAEYEREMEAYELELEVVITRLARYGPTIIVEKTVQKHQTMAALADTCPRAKKPAIYPPGTVRGLPEPVVLSMSTPGMDAHWSGVSLEPDPPQYELNPSFQKTRLRVEGRHPLAKSETTPKPDSSGGAGSSSNKGRAKAGRPRKSEKTEAGGGGGQLWLGRVTGPSSSGAKRKHGSVVTTTTGAGEKAGGGGKAAKTTVKRETAPEKKATGQQQKGGRNGEVSKEGKASSSGAGSRGELDATGAHAIHQSNTAEVRMQQARQLLWAQSLHGAAYETVPVVRELALQNQASTTEANVPVARNAKQRGFFTTTTSDSPIPADSTDATNSKPGGAKIIRDQATHFKNNPEGVRRVNLTVNWQARTRIRSGMQPLSVKLVTVDVHPGEIAARFISRMVQMPPGGAYNDTQLNWGSFVLQPTQVMETFYIGTWVLNLRSDPPPELVLVLPVGSLLVHPALCDAAGWRFSVMRPIPGAPGAGGDNNSSEQDNAGKHDNLLIDGWVPTKKAVKAAAADGISVPPGRGAYPGSSTLHRADSSDDKKELKDLSNRALHPGRTDPKRMAQVLREYGVVVDNEPCSIVDVGSGDGHFVNGLIKAFPQACLCGIECQRDLYEESVKLVGRNANFILGTAETQLAQCLSVNIIIATTHNFDVSTIVSMVRCAARLPAVTHLVLGESRLCTPRCKAICGPCCCFEPLGTEDVSTYWGNSQLPFTIYRRLVPWMLEANEVPRMTDEATLAALNTGKLDPHNPQHRQRGSAEAGPGPGSGSGSGAGAAAVAIDGGVLGGGAGGDGRGGERGGVTSGEEAGAGGGGHASLEAVRMAAARTLRSVNPPEKFSDHDMKVRRHKYPSKTERANNAKDAAEESGDYEWAAEGAEGGGDGKVSAPQAPNNAKAPGFVGRLLKFVGVQED